MDGWIDRCYFSFIFLGKSDHPMIAMEQPPQMPAAEPGNGKTHGTSTDHSYIFKGNCVGRRRSGGFSIVRLDWTLVAVCC